MAHAKRMKGLLFQAGRKMRAMRGFTLTELLACVVILAVLGTIVAAALPGALSVSKSATRQSQADALSLSIDTSIKEVLRYSSACLHDGDVVVHQAPSGPSPVFSPSSDFVDENGAVPMRSALGSDDRVTLITLDPAPARTVLPKASGIYTDFRIVGLTLSYDVQSNSYQGGYTIESLDGSYAKEYAFSCEALAPPHEVG